MSELHAATIGILGCGAVNHIRSMEGGVKSDRKNMPAVFAAIMSSISRLSLLFL